jgi:hypothetical protein
METPSISVVVVCDYDAGKPGGWADIRKTLQALALQDLAEPAEFILCESEAFRDSLPSDFAQIIPNLKILFAPGRASHYLKNVAVAAASSEFIAMLDADCVPRPDWLRRLLDSLRKHPQAAAISGKTTYPGASLWARINSLLSRAYVDPGGYGRTTHISDNNAAYRRSAYLANPLPTDMGGFSAHVQAEAMLHNGCVLWFDPSFCVHHDYEGFAMERDIRRHRGHSAILTRRLDPTLPYGWLMRFGPLSVAPILAGKILLGSWDCIRCGRNYGIRWYELPASIAASFGLTLLEVPGMFAAFHEPHFGKSCFR